MALKNLSTTMLGWGILTLGATAAHATGFILARVRSTGGLALLLAISPVYCSAALVFFHPEFQNGKAIELYPAGLLISFSWQQAWPLIERTQIEWIKKFILLTMYLILGLMTGILIVYAILTP